MIIIQSGQSRLIAAGLAGFQPEHYKGDSQQAHFRKETNLPKQDISTIQLNFFKSGDILVWAVEITRFKAMVKIYCKTCIKEVTWMKTCAIKIHIKIIPLINLQVIKLRVFP